MTTYAPQEAPADTPRATTPVMSNPVVQPVPKRRRGWVGWMLFILAAAAASYAGVKWGVPWWKAQVAARQPAEKPAPRVIPVVAATVTQDDVQLYLTGLGSVTAYNTVTLRSRVDGHLDKVHFTEGQMVEQGQLLAEIDSREFEVQLANAQGQLARDEATAKNAAADLERYKLLIASNSITTQQLEAQQALVEQWAGTIKTDQAQIDNAKLMVSYCKITAPLSGRIGLRTVDQGNMVRASDVQGLAVITQVQPIAMTFTIPQDEIGRLQTSVRQRPDLPVEIYDRGFQGKLATGSLLAVDNQVDISTGTLKLKAEFPNEERRLFPNQFVNVRLLVDKLENATLVPAAAVQRGPHSKFVYVVKPDETVEVRDIEAGASQDNWIAVESGLTAGEVVVIDGVDKLQPGTKVLVELRGSLQPDRAGSQQAGQGLAKDSP